MLGYKLFEDGEDYDEGRSGHAYALVKPKAGGSRDFEFANYPAFLIVARD